MDLSNINHAVVRSTFKPQVQSLTKPTMQHSGAEKSENYLERRETSLKTLERLVAQAYEQLSMGGKDYLQSINHKNAVAAYDAVEPMTADKVAGNILGFIERRLMLDVADGATPDQLQSRLEAGLRGFELGYGQAKEQLEALAMLSPEISSDIQSTYDLVLKGLDDLRDRFLKPDEVTNEII
ncbi:MAG: DUF5610 domain-containing protein [Cellvibrio sp.]